MPFERRHQRRRETSDEWRVRRTAIDAIARTRPDHDGRPQSDELRHGRGALPLAAVLEGLVRDQGLRGRDRVQDAFDALREVAGPLVAPRLVPLRLRGRELVVRVDSAALYQELTSFGARSLEERFARACAQRGLSGVDRLVLRQTS